MLRIALLFGLAAGAASQARAAVPALMPMPAKVVPASGTLVIDGGFTAAATGYSDARLQAAIERFSERLSRRTGIPFGLAPSAASGHATLRVECTGGAEYPALGEDESYVLEVSTAGATLKAPRVAGALHGLETFGQLIGPGADGFAAPAIRIEDQPRFPWRGLMMDVSRHWMPLAVVERNLDAMAAVKLNVFHWHLSDDQGFRVESKLYPKLQQLGSDGHFYTQAQISHVVQYAARRGIRVVPEFDIPAHTTSWFPGYPELASTAGFFSIGRTWGIFDPVMDPTRDEVYEFLDAFIGEMAQLFPDPYFHIGGDEVNGRQWTQSARIQQFARDHHLEGTHGLQVYFNQRVQKLVARHGKTMIGWDEVLQPDLPQETVIQSWRGQAALAEAATTGHRAILSWGYYLDHLRPASYHYAVDPLGGPAAQLNSEQAARILGGEACMWAEYANAETVDSRIWPRAAVVAEKLWSPGSVSDVDSMYARMEQISRLLEWTGVEHRATYTRMLDRLAGGRPAEPLRILANASEAQGLGPRSRTRKYTSLIPLNRFVDSVPPESESIRALEQAARRVARNPAANAEDAQRLREQFAQWAANDPRFQAMAEGNLLLSELRPLSADLAALGAMGLRALNYLSHAQPTPAGWAAAQAPELTRIEKPQEEVVLAAVRPVRLLVEQLARGPKR